MQDPFEVAVVSDSHQTIVTVKVPKDHKLYADKVGFQVLGGELSDYKVIGELKRAYDEFSDGSRSYYEEDVKFVIRSDALGSSFTFMYQGCHAGKVCYMPRSLNFVKPKFGVWQKR